MAETGQDSDELLMSRIRGGDHGAFSVLVRRHSKMFYAAAYRMCGDVQSSEDTVQEAFLKLWQKPDAWDPAKGTKFTTWFYRVVTNQAIDRQRREKKKYANPDVMNVIADKSPHADQVLQASEEEQALERAIAALPERQRTALNLCVYEGLSNKEAAEVLGVGVKALESLLMRAKAGLRDEFKREGLIPAALGEDTYERKRSHV
jgi:RNA polymerase sigma-70 factor, ECF subfamily